MDVTMVACGHAGEDSRHYVPLNTLTGGTDIMQSPTGAGMQLRAFGPSIQVQCASYVDAKRRNRFRP